MNFQKKSLFNGAGKASKANRADRTGGASRADGASRASKAGPGPEGAGLGDV